MADAVRMDVNLGGIHMRNPINTASVTFGNGRQFEGFYDVGATLGIESGTATLISSLSCISAGSPVR